MTFIGALMMKAFTKLQESQLCEEFILVDLLYLIHFTKHCVHVT